ncbi:MAG TPA: hypothetical protein VGB61_15900, partial [Pyrinomonadaceae bacterium]
IHNHPQLRARTLFATHYHELTALAPILPRLENLHVEIAEQGSDLIFLYKISPGCAERSYGVYAAKLAGLPRPVVRRAEELLAEYEAQSGERPFPGEAAKQTAPIHPREREAKVIQVLMQLDPDALAPVEALMKLFELRRLAQEEAEDELGQVRAIRTA